MWELGYWTLEWLRAHPLPVSNRGPPLKFSSFFLFTLQGASEQGLEKIPEPIKEATALFYGEEGLVE